MIVVRTYCNNGTNTDELCRSRRTSEHGESW
jgi:hypothetical protein